MTRDGQRWRARDWWICSIIGQGFALCGRPCLWAFIPPSLHPSLCLFSPAEVIMRELYRPWQISVSLPHNTNNRGYHERREGGIVCTSSTNTRSHLVCAGVSVFSSPVYFRLALCCEKRIRPKPMRNSFHFPKYEVLASCMLSGSVDVWSYVHKRQSAKTHTTQKNEYFWKAR